MNWYTIFYLFGLSDKIAIVTGTIAIIFSIIGGIATFIYIGMRWDNYADIDTSLSGKCMKVFVPWAVLSVFIWTFVPDKKDMLLIIAGGSVGEFVVSDDNAKEIPADITRFLRTEILTATSELNLKKELGIETVEDKLQKKTKQELINMLSDSTITN